MKVADGSPLWTVSAEDMARSEPASGPAMASLDTGLIGPAGVSPGQRAADAGDPYPGGVRAPADGAEPPSTHPVKVHTGSGRYHTTESPYYVRTRADLYFVGAREAEAAGFVAWNSRPGGGSG
ncbi:hypothetical protein [Pseudonocardia endophytica]|uniref:Uncharacterized protein n=1 Tax=Pseudonocardia endophytica TaxID=401976 RepID=A0A4R1HF35_PSEEN|nr:hypothetical protein [Pseudonocardia endophytica]TCK20248.1 hypothetical protein EV378_4199 [Pseudonocardia endophytica]